MKKITHNASLSLQLIYTLVCFLNILNSFALKFTFGTSAEPLFGVLFTILTPALVGVWIALPLSLVFNVRKTLSSRREGSRRWVLWLIWTVVSPILYIVFFVLAAVTLVDVTGGV